MAILVIVIAVEAPVLLKAYGTSYGFDKYNTYYLEKIS